MSGIHAEMNIIRSINADLLASLKECLPHLGWRNMSDDELKHEHELGNGFAKPILRARAAIRKAEGNIR